MIKYIVLVGILLIGSLLFVNKDRIFSQNSENMATVSNLDSQSAIQKKPPARCRGLGFTGQYLCVSCPRLGYDIYWSDYTSAMCTLDADTATSTTKYFTLKLHYEVANVRYGGYAQLGTVSPAKPGKYTAGTTAVLTASPIKGFKTVWDGGPCITLNQDTCKIKMDSNKTVKVSFVQKPGWKCSIIGGYLECNKEW